MSLAAAFVIGVLSTVAVVLAFALLAYQWRASSAGAARRRERKLATREVRYLSHEQLGSAAEAQWIAAQLESGGFVRFERPLLQFGNLPPAPPLSSSPS